MWKETTENSMKTSSFSLRYDSRKTMSNALGLFYNQDW